VQRLDRVQYLRGAAALVVLFSHILLSMRALAERGGVSFPPWSISGEFGVDIFFVISGFIMVFTAGTGFGRPGAPSEFMRRRLIRIVPPYWLLTLVMAAVLFVSTRGGDHPLTAFQVLGSLSFIPYEWHGKFRPVLGVGWSLSYEMLFYGLFAVSLYFRRGMLVLTGLLTALVVIGLFNPPTPPLMAWTRPILVEFLIGAWLGVLYRRGVRIAVPFPMVIAVFLIVLQGFIPGADQGVDAWKWVNWPLASIIVALGALTPARESGSALLSGLGDRSYSLYLSHPITLTLLEYAWGRVLAPTPWTLGLFAVTGISLAIGVAWLLFAWFERPVTKGLRRWTESPPSKPAAAVPNSEAA
jgi:peptidoglycan/LPS O-acetylase OafA/YrhL